MVHQIGSDLSIGMFGDKELTNESSWFSRVFTFVNQLYSVANPISQIWMGLNLSAPTSIASDNAFHPVVLDTEAFNTFAGFGSRLSSGGFLVPATADYLVAGAVTFVANGSGTRRGVQIAQNGIGLEGTLFFSAPCGSPQQDDIPAGCSMVTLTAGDLITLTGFQDSGANLNTDQTSGSHLVVLRMS